MKRIRLVASTLALAVGCGGASPSAKNADDAESADSPKASASSAGSGAGADSDATRSESSEFETSGEAKSASSASSGSGAETLDFHGWCYDHGIEASLPVDACEASGFGKPPGDAIWCRRHEDSPDGVAAYFQALYVVRGKRLVKLIELPVAAGLTVDVENPRPESERFKVKLALSKSEDGKSVTLGDDANLDCSHATEQNKDLTTTDPKLGAKLGAAIQKVCAARGRYAWNGGALTKVLSKP